MAIVYRHIRLDKNEPFYIGIGKDIKRAFRKDSRNDYWNNISKNGYEVEILFENLTWEEACEKEKEFIKLYGRKDKGTGILCNMTDGGDGVDFTPEVRNKISEKMKSDNPTKRKDVKEKISTTLKKYFEINKTTHTEETREKLKQINLGRYISHETKEKMSLSKLGKTSPRKGVKLSDETKLKLRLSNLGKKQSPETIKKRTETRLKNKLNKGI
jgi:hypothetical protein